MRSDNLYALPEVLPVPVDDGACDHLPGMQVPPIRLRSTADRDVSLLDSTERRTVVYCYPRTGTPDKDPPPGWNEIPGARGCTPQSCGFRDRFDEFRRLDVQVYGLSTQTTEYQKEMARRINLPFEVLSDADLAFTRALKLPAFTVESMTLLKRLTLVIHRGRIVKVFYPVFPPDKNADEVISWLAAHPLDAVRD